MKHNSLINKTLNYIADSILWSNIAIKFDVIFFRRLNWILLISISLMVTYMFSLKNFVQDLNFEQKQLTSQIDNEKTQINLLNAEYAYLSSPERLRFLAEKYLDLDEVKPSQILADNNMKAQTRFINLTNGKSKKWRYKKPDIFKTSSDKKIGR